MRRHLAVGTLLAFLLLTGCGRYGPPVRAQHAADPPAAERPAPEDARDADEDPDE